MKHHQYASLFPMQTDEEIHSLADDIRANGLRQPIVIDDNDEILDGRNRAAACIIAGVEPVYEPFVGSDAETLAFVVSLNLHRRHLTTAQRSMVADKLASLKQGEKKADSGIPLSQPTQAEAAAMLNVSVDSVKQARKIRKAATLETVAAVERGEMSLNEAVATVKPVAAMVTIESGPVQDDSQVDSKIRAKARSGEVTQEDVIAVDQQLTAMANTHISADAIVDWFSKQSPRKKMAFIKKCHADADVIKLRSGNHNSLMQVAADALYRLPSEDCGEVICRHLVMMTPEFRDKVYATVDHVLKKQAKEHSV
jgi:hypothetical protein